MRSVMVATLVALAAVSAAVQAYKNVDEGCVGVVKGTTKVPADRKVISGNATIGGDCSPEGVPGTLTFTQQQKK